MSSIDSLVSTIRRFAPRSRRQRQSRSRPAGGDRRARHRHRGAPDATQAVRHASRKVRAQRAGGSASRGCTPITRMSDRHPRPRRARHEPRGGAAAPEQRRRLSTPPTSTMKHRQAIRLSGAHRGSQKSSTGARGLESVLVSLQTIRGAAERETSSTASTPPSASACRGLISAKSDEDRSIARRDSNADGVRAWPVGDCRDHPAQA